MTSGVMFRPRRADMTVPSAVVETNGLNVMDFIAIFISVKTVSNFCINSYI